jgi:hypothetical protein
MTDPVTNSLALQTQFGDDDLKKEVDQHIINLATGVAQAVVREAFNNPDNFRRLLVNNQFDFEVGVMRAMKSFLNNPKNIY